MLPAKVQKEGEEKFSEICGLLDLELVAVGNTFT